MTLTPGRKLGSYDVVSLLGRGGMGEVYRAHDSRLKRDVALKVLQLDNPESRVRFEREARAVAALNHPNIVTIHSVEEVDGIPFLTMELIEGEPLSAQIAAGGMPLDKVLDLAIPIAEALGAAHRKGIIHRDLKPGNIMTTADGHVKILDFGLAKALSARRLETRPSTRRSLASRWAPSLICLPNRRMVRCSTSAAICFRSGWCSSRWRPDGGRSREKRTWRSSLRFSIVRRRPSAARTRTSIRSSPERWRKARPSRYQRAEELIADLRALQSGARLAAATTRPAGPSIAVLPFANMSADPDQEYFCDGMAEELISAFARIKGLSVAARTSAFLFKGQKVDVRQIGERLMVATVLEGSVRKMGNRLRIAAQLMNVHNGYQIWADRYDRNIDDVFAIQDEIAHAITESLKVALVGPSDEPIVRKPTANLEAYHLYLRGRFLVNRLNGQFEALFAARDAFQQAVALDPEYAAAYAGLSEAYCSLAYLTFMPTKEASEAAIGGGPSCCRSRSWPGGGSYRGRLDQDPVRHRSRLRPNRTSSAPSSSRPVSRPRTATTSCSWPRSAGSTKRWRAPRAHASSIRCGCGDRSTSPSRCCAPGALKRRSGRCAKSWRSIQTSRAPTGFSAPLWPDRDAWTRQSPPLKRACRSSIARRCSWRCSASGTRAPAGVPMPRRSSKKCWPVGDVRQSGLPSSTPVWAIWIAPFRYLERAIEEHNDQVCFMGVDHRFDEMRGDPRFDALLARIGLAPAR